MTKIETENLLALLQGIDLTAYQKGLAINEYNRLIIRINELERKLRQFAVMPSLPTDEDIMRWSKEFNEDDIVEQGRFRTIAKFVRICLQEGNGA